MRGKLLLGALALLVAAPAASAVTVVAEREGELFVVTVTGDDEPATIDLVVSHTTPQGEVVDHLRPLDLAAREVVRVELEGLPVGPSYAVYAAARGSMGAPPSSPARPTSPPASQPPPMGWAPPSLASVAFASVVTVDVVPAFEGLPTGRSATVFPPEEHDLLVVRESVEGALEAAISRDGGRSFSPAVQISPPARTPGAVRVFWDDTRFADGTVGVVYRQFEQDVASAAGDWALVRLDLARQAIVARQTLAFDASQFIEGESLELYTLPNERTILLAETKDLTTSYSIDSPSALRVWTVTSDGKLVDEARIPLQHGILPRFETASTVDGILRIAWTHGATQSEPARKLWTTTSTDGRAFSEPVGIDLPFPIFTRPHLASADIDPDGTLHVAVVADDPVDNDDALFYVRAPLEGAASTLDVRSLEARTPPPGPPLEPRVTAYGDRVLVHWFDAESFVVESLDGGTTFGPVLMLRDQTGTPFFVTDTDVRADGAPIYMTTSERCKNCFGVVSGRDQLEMSPWFGGPIDILPEFPPAPPQVYELPPRSEPMRPTPGIAPVVALVAIAALARLRLRR